MFNFDRVDEPKASPNVAKNKVDCCRAGKLMLCKTDICVEVHEVAFSLTAINV